MSQNQAPTYPRIHHIGVTVKDAHRAVQEWGEAFGFAGRVVEIPEHNMRIGVVEVAGMTFFLNEYCDPEKQAQATGDLALPVTFSGHRIVNKHGEGISHIAIETNDLEAVTKRATVAGMQFTLDEPRHSLEGICNFVVPEDAHIPLEFMQPVEGKENPLA